MSKCYHIFTHNDFDGAVSLLAFMWARPEGIFHFEPLNNMDLEDKLRIHLDNTCDDPSIVVLDLALRDELVPILNRKGVTIIDHHKSSERFIEKFDKAKVFYKDFSSCALLVRKLLAATSPELTIEQKLLIALADDFDCYRLQLPDSYDLNILFWSEYRGKFAKFIKDYQKGFKPFTPEQKRAIAYIKKEAVEEAEKVDIFYGELLVGGKKKKVIAGMTQRLVPMVMDHLIKKHTPDLFFFININTQKVSLRQCTKEDPIDIGLFAEKICDGGGHEFAAGGKITPLFLEITKNLKPL